MHGVEFQTTVKGGVIEIPPEYRSQFKAGVRVILFSEEVAESLTRDAQRPFGLACGAFRVPDDFDAPLPEYILREFEGS